LCATDDGNNPGRWGKRIERKYANCLFLQKSVGLVMLVKFGIPLLNLGRIDRRGRISALGRRASDETLSSGKKSGEECDTRLLFQHYVKF
jgi:hypothetical protein